MPKEKSWIIPKDLLLIEYKNYERGDSTKVIAKRNGYTYQGICRAFKRLGLQLRRKGRQPYKHLNKQNLCNS